MTKTQRQKLEVPFHRLTEEEIRQWYQDKLLTTAGYLLAIKRVTRPPGADFVIPNVTKFCKEWRISKSAFYRAVDELKLKGYTNWEATHGIVLRESKRVLSFSSDKKCPMSGIGVPQLAQVSHERDTDSHERDTDSHGRDTDSHERENQSPEPAQHKAYSNSQTIQTYTDTTDKGECKKSFEDGEQTSVEEIGNEMFAPYEERLRLQGIYRLKWTENGLIENPRLKPVLRALKETPPERAERAIVAFLSWASSATNVRDIYKALEVAILRGWLP